MRVFADQMRAVRRPLARRSASVRTAPPLKRRGTAQSVRLNKIKTRRVSATSGGAVQQKKFSSNDATAISMSTTSQGRARASSMISARARTPI